MGATEQDLLLIARIVSGDESAAEEFDRRFRPYLVRFAAQRINADEIADVVQDTLFAAAREIRAENFAGRSEVGSWLVRILRNKIADHCRKRKREMQTIVPPPTLSHFADAIYDPADPAQADPGLAIEIEELLSTLPKEQRVLITLHLREGWTTEEIAQRMRMVPSTVGGILWRAKRALQKQGRGLKKLDGRSD